MEVVLDLHIFIIMHTHKIHFGYKPNKSSSMTKWERVKLYPINNLVNNTWFISVYSKCN